LETFARKEFTHDDHVVVEATGNAAAVVEVLAPYVDRVVIAKQVRLIAHAKIKTDANWCRRAREAARYRISSGGLGTR
jgi:hypothetical protein